MLSFDAPSHTYRWNGKLVPSVTQVIGEWQKINVYGIHYYCNAFTGVTVQEIRFDEARDYGSAVHCMLALYLRGELDVDALHPDLSRTLEQFQRWFRDSKVKPILIETPLYSERGRYAGTPDLICESGGRITVVEYKTGGHDMAGVQTAGYHGLYKPFTHKQRVVLYMPRGGALKVLPCVNQADFAMFQARLAQFYYLQGVK